MTCKKIFEQDFVDYVDREKCKKMQNIKNIEQRQKQKANYESLSQHNKEKRANCAKKYKDIDFSTVILVTYMKLHSTNLIDGLEVESVLEMINQPKGYQRWR